jgi:hypothetical protein
MVGSADSWVTSPTAFCLRTTASKCEPRPDSGRNQRLALLRSRLCDCRARIRWRRDSRGEGGEHISRGMKPGDVAFRKKVEVHRAVNTGRAQYRNIRIELK